ncbi:SCO2524 family protein [Sphaerisporangium sp. NPDC049002]|uniref:SCO2524 family protein n=1 Tax=unclassified Sphaerisporangium TaxID=2630420 RepID=UPI0033DA0BBF
MKLQPRQQLLEVWKAVSRASIQDGRWTWGGRDGSNSISDTEQLLCLMFPASELVGFKLDVPDETAEDVLDALGALGDSVEIPKTLIKVIGEYLDAYTDDMGRPVFAGGSYFKSNDPDQEPTKEQQRLDVVDSFSMSVTLMLSVLGFLRVFRRSVRREDLLKEIADVETRAGKRLSAAMVNLLRSFTINVFDPASPQGKALIRSVNQENLPERRVVEELQKQLTGVRAGLRDLTIGSGQVDLDNHNLIFECGWSWGIVQDAPEVETDLDVGPQPNGIAPNLPFLYFTVIALTTITDLFSERTRVLGLLDDEQQQLANALQRRWDLTQAYWARVAMYGRGRWPLEDIPWRTTDDVESDYFSLLVTAMVVENLLSTRATDTVLSRVAGILDELAMRARITRRATRDDPPVRMHSPGVVYQLDGSDALGPPMHWLISDFSITLLKRTMGVASIARSTQMRERLLSLADEIWDHISHRRYTKGPATGLWDQPSRVFTDLEPVTDLPSWYFTERAVEFLVSAAKTIETQPIRSPLLADIANEMLSEAEHLYDQEQLIWVAGSRQALQPKLRSIEANLGRARVIIRSRPGSAIALVSECLRDLELLALARENATEGG